MSRTVDIPLVPVFEPLLQPARYKGAYGGRGSAKSHFFADLLIDDSLTHRGLRAVCIREYQVSLEQSVKRLLEDKIKQYNLGREFRVMDSRIETPGDGVIIFQGMQAHNAESIKSLEGYHRAWVEEAQNLSLRSLNLLRPTIREPGSELWFSWNPRDPKDPVDVMLRKNPPPNAIVVKSNYYDNPFFPDVLRTEMEWDKQRDEDKYKHVWLGGYEERSESRVFKNWKVEEFETPSDVRFNYGADWGYSVDPATLIRNFIVGRRLFIDRELYKIGVEIDHLPGFFSTMPGSKDWPIVADSARPETISYMQRHGFPKMKPAIKGKDSVKEGVIFVQGYDVVIHPRCVHTIDEFTSYSYKVDPKTEKVLQPPVLEDKKNHIIDPVRYSLEELRHGFDFQQAGMTSAVTW